MKPLIDRTESSIAARDGTRLACRAWLPPEPGAAVLIVHGYAEHSGRYDHVGVGLAERGYAVHAYDHRGHGRSEGVRCYVSAFSEFLDDLEEVMAMVAAAHRGLPLVLLGHSMGGLVVTSLLRERKPAIAAAITSGAALALPESFPAWRLVAARLLRRVAPRLALASGLDVSGLSRDTDVVAAYRSDPLVHERMTSSLATELFAALEQAEGGGGAVEVPMLMLHGGADRVCDPRGTRAFFETLDVEGSDLRIYPELYHEVLNEPESERVLGDVVEWLTARGLGGATPR